MSCWVLVCALALLNVLSKSERAVSVGRFMADSAGGALPSSWKTNTHHSGDLLIIIVERDSARARRRRLEAAGGGEMLRARLRPRIVWSKLYSAEFHARTILIRNLVRCGAENAI